MDPAANTPHPSHYVRLAWSNLAAQSAEQLSVAAASMVAVLALGAGAGKTGAIQAVQTLPYVLFALPLGLLADRYSRRSLMAGAEALRAVSLLAILGLLLCGWLNVPLLAILGFAGACGTVAYTVAAPSLVPSLVPAAELNRANSWIELARTVAFAAGPAAAGLLIGWAGGSVAFGCAAALSCGAVVLLAGLHEPARPPVPPRHPLHDLREGAGFVFGHRLLLPVFVTLFLFNTAFFMGQAVYVPYAVAHLGLAASGVGATLGAFGIGMVAGAVCAPRVLNALPFGKVVALGPVIAFAGSLLLALTILVPSSWLAAGSFLLLGAGPPFWVISTTTLRQAVTPPEMMGRSFAINILAYGARPIGAGLGAALGSAYGTEVCIGAAACGFLLQALVPLLSPLGRLANQPEFAAIRFT